MTITRRKRIGALVAGFGVVAGSGVASASTATTAPTDTSAATETTAAGGSDTTAASGSETTTAGTTSDTSAGTTAGTAAGSGTPMTITYDLNPEAVWDDGTPISIEDFQCTLDAVMNTPGSLSTVGYELITSIEQGDSPQQIVVTLSEPYAPYKNLFGGGSTPILKSSSLENCMDVSGDMQDIIPFSAQPYKMDSWSLDQSEFSANENYWGDAPVTPRIVAVPRDDSSLMSGEVDFIFPQAFAGLTDTLDGDSNISYTPGYGTNYEGLYFQQNDGPFADDAFREGFARSIDRNLIMSTIYEPLFPGGPMLNCGLWVPNIGDWCDNSAFGNDDGTDGIFDPAKAEEVLTAGGWEKDASGMWAKDGEVPTIRWMVNSGNTRREDTQALMIPELANAGFNVVADNCEAACVFQQRMPALDYDLGMYIQTASPDPTVTAIMSCDAIPSDANNNVGQNSTGWCNEDASALMVASDQNLDVASRVDQIHEVAHALATDFVMLPLYQFPNIAAWNTTKLGGPVDADAANFMAFQNWDQWEDLDGDGQIILGAEQWPECLNPVTECANSSWMVWTSSFKVLPSVYETTGTGEYVPSDLLTGEPVVTVGGEPVDTGAAPAATDATGTTEAMTGTTEAMTGTTAAMTGTTEAMVGTTEAATATTAG